MMQEYMQEISKLEKILNALEDARDIAMDCDDDESAEYYMDAIMVVNKMRDHRIERIRNLSNVEDADLLFWLYVEEETPKEIRRNNKWSTSEYSRRLRQALTAYRNSMRI